MSQHTRECRYDRPGTIVPNDSGASLTTRSSAVAMPRTNETVAADLDALIAAAGLQAPFLLVGHSYGGWLMLNYAQSHPTTVVGLLAVDAFSTGALSYWGPLWPAYENVFNSAGGNPVENDPAFETFDVAASVTWAESLPALPPSLPYAVISKTDPFPLPAGDIGFTSADLEGVWAKVQAELVGLQPDTPHIIATGSDHYVQVREPDLVTAAVLMLLERSRNDAP